MRVVTITCDICGAPAQTGYAGKQRIKVDAVSHNREPMPMLISTVIRLAESDEDDADLCVRCRADLLRRLADLLLLAVAGPKEPTS